MAYAFNDDKGKYDLDENVLGGASNTLYDAELAIAENAADIADLRTPFSQNLNSCEFGTHTYCEIRKLGKLVYVSFRFTTPSSVAAGWHTIYKLPFQVAMNNSFRAFTGTAGETPIIIDGIATGYDLNLYIGSYMTNKAISGSFAYIAM